MLTFYICSTVPLAQRKFSPPIPVSYTVGWARTISDGYRGQYINLLSKTASYILLLSYKKKKKRTYRKSPRVAKSYSKVNLWFRKCVPRGRRRFFPFFFFSPHIFINTRSGPRSDTIRATPCDKWIRLVRIFFFFLPGSGRQREKNEFSIEIQYIFFSFSFFSATRRSVVTLKLRSDKGENRRCRRL